MALPPGSGAPAPPKPAKPPKAGKGKPNKNLAKAAAGPVPGSPAYQAQQEIDPIIAAIKAAAASEAGSADKAIEGLTNSYAKGIAGIDYGAPYSGAEAQQAAVDNALRQSATGQGSDLASQLSQRLQALQGTSGAGAVNQEASALSNQGLGIGNADLAGGSAELGRLISDAAAAKSYGQKMPGVIRSAGLQGIAQAQGQAQQAINQGTLQAESQVPSIIQTIKADKQAQQAAKQTAAYQRAEMAYKQASLNSTNAYRQAEIGLRGQALQISAQRAANSNKAQWARIGIENQRLQLEISKQDMSARTGGLTPAETSRYKALAESWAQRTVGSYTNPTTGNVEKPMSFKDAMTNALKEGVPLSIAFPEFVKTYKPNPTELKALKKYYGPLDSSLNRAAQQAARMAAMNHQAGNDILGSMFSGPVSAQKATNPQGAKSAAFQMASRYGWGDKQNLTALEELWTRESGWNFQAKNSSSGALGIPQALGHKLPPGYANNPLVQIQWGLRYIKGRYGSPANAWAHEMKFGWY